jgi:putative DNA primase/helicase
MCGGKDRFRYIDTERRGTWICTHCGGGDGMDLATQFTGRAFRDMAAEIDGILGRKQLPSDPEPKRMTEDDQRAALRSLFAGSALVEDGDPAHRYLSARGLGDPMLYGNRLLFNRAVFDGEGGVRPCMVAVVSDAAGRNCTLHRTFLHPTEPRKAEMDPPRKLMPGAVPDGAAVRLCDWQGGPLGVAEGVETALAAATLFEMPVWSAIDAGKLAKWVPPEGCDELAIFGDRDGKFGGQAAAFRLAHRLACDQRRPMAVSVHIPDVPGDWNDVLMSRRR